MADSLDDATLVVAAYCESKVSEHLRGEVRIECNRRGRTISIVDRRPPWNPEFGPEWSTTKVAQLRFDESARTWTLHWPDRNGRWHRYDQLPPRRTVSSLLAEIDADPTGIFWG